jgi:hypothetical protein
MSLTGELSAENIRGKIYGKYRMIRERLESPLEKVHVKNPREESTRRARIFARRLLLSHIFIKGVVTGRTGRYLVRGEWKGRMGRR